MASEIQNARLLVIVWFANATSSHSGGFGSSECEASVWVCLGLAEPAGGSGPAWACLSLPGLPGLVWVCLGLSELSKVCLGQSGESGLNSSRSRYAEASSQVQSFLRCRGFVRPAFQAPAVFCSLGIPGSGAEGLFAQLARRRLGFVFWAFLAPMQVVCSHSFPGPGWSVCLCAG